MNQQNQGPGSASSVPIKRKRGRPRKEESVVQGENIPVMVGSENVLHSNQTAGTTDDCDDEMVGKVVTGVIEGTFNAGYLLNVKVADTDACLRGVVFLPGQVTPITPENDVAPHVKMIKRKEIPIPVLNLQTETHGSVPSSVQCSKPPFQPEMQMPMPKEQVLPAEIHSLENQPASTILPMPDLSKNETSIPQGIAEPGNASQSPSIMSELECDKAIEQDETLHASMQVKESSAEGGETKASQPAYELINLVPTIQDTDKQAVPCVHKPNELIQDEPNTSHIELNQTPVTAEPESMPSERISKSVDNLVEEQALPKTDLAIETFSNVDTSNSSGRPSTDAANILDVGSNIQLEFMPSEHISKPEPSTSMFSFEGCDFQEKSDSQNCSSFGALDKVDVNQPTESLVDSVESEKQIGSDIS